MLGLSCVFKVQVEAISRSTEEAYKYADEHLDIGRYISGGVQHYFVDFHYYIGIEEKEGRPQRDPVDLLFSMADHYGNSDGSVKEKEREELAMMLDRFLPKLADFEYGAGDGIIRMTEYEKMLSDLSTNQTFDMARRFGQLPPANSSEFARGLSKDKS